MSRNIDRLSRKHFYSAPSSKGGEAILALCGRHRLFRAFFLAMATRSSRFHPQKSKPRNSPNCDLPGSTQRLWLYALGRNLATTRPRFFARMGSGSPKGSPGSRDLDSFGSRRRNQERSGTSGKTFAQSRIPQQDLGSTLVPSHLLCPSRQSSFLSPMGPSLRGTLHGGSKAALPTDRILRHCPSRSSPQFPSEKPRCTSRLPSVPGHPPGPFLP